MAVAKSYQNLKQLCEPYEINGRMYVKVETAKGGSRQVRWYSDYEYAKLYGEKTPTPKVIRTQRQVLGFEHGYITLLKGDTYNLRDWLKSIGARYTRWWGWYIQSTDTVPETIPAGIDTVKLEWKNICAPDGENLANEDSVVEYVESLIYDEGNSQFVGKIGERLELNVKITKVIKLENGYGSSNMHIMEDANENIYIWTTATKDLSENVEYHIKGTVKDHRTYHNNKQTILTRCTILG